VANFLVWVVWFVAAFACLASALAVVSFRNPFYSALALIGNLASLAVLFLLLSGEFVAAGQVLVYGGAVMVMFLFVIAYLGDRTEDSPRSVAADAELVIRITPAGEQALSTTRWRVVLKPEFGETVVRVRAQDRPWLLAVLAGAR